VASPLTKTELGQRSVQNISILGSTGSIGQSTLDVIALHPDRYKVFALTANNSVDTLFEQCKKYQPQIAVLKDETAAEKLSQALKKEGLSIIVESGIEALEKVASHESVDTVMAAIVGAAGLLPTIAAVKAGKKTLLANKEALVMSGQLFMSLVKENNAQLLPIDSEHNAIFQCMPLNDSIENLSRELAPGKVYAERGVRRILLTASGGPFLKTPADQLVKVTPEQAIAHPNWDMGRKISVDSATMMNKGLEVIEACWLFGAEPDQIEVVIHPQSVIHSMVDYQDGSVLAQLGNPDMRTPIAYGLSWPERIESGVSPLDIFNTKRLDFEKPDIVQFPCLDLAYQAMKAGGAATCVLNAANEVAVDAFLNEQIKFTDIAKVIEKVLSDVSFESAVNLDQVIQYDQTARQRSDEIIAKLCSDYGNQKGNC